VSHRVTGFESLPLVFCVRGEEIARQKVWNAIGGIMSTEKSLVRVNDRDADKAGAGMSGTQPRKPYNAPHVIEHGSVEKITGFFTECIGSGCRVD
jgi:hypothetical protein